MKKIMKLAQQFEETLQSESVSTPNEIEGKLRAAINKLYDELYLINAMGAVYNELYKRLIKIENLNYPDKIAAIESYDILSYPEPNIKEKVSNILYLKEELEKAQVNVPTKLEDFDF